MRERQASKNIPSVNSSSTPKESLFSVKGQLVSILGFQAIWSLLQLFNSAIAEWSLAKGYQYCKEKALGILSCEVVTY